MHELVEFLAGFETGATEEELSARFPSHSKDELAVMLNSFVESRLIDIVEDGGRLCYRAVQSRASDYESMVLALLSKAGTAGLWLRDIKAKTNIPHNLILKLLRSLEVSRKIKSVRSVKNNRKMYMLYEMEPDDNVTGGVWFNNNDVDLVFVDKLLDIIYRFCARPEEPYALPRLSSLARLSAVHEFIVKSKITEASLTFAEVSTLVDALVFDGRLEKYEFEDGVALRALPLSG